MFGAMIELDDLDQISFIQKELLVNVKHEMTYVYFQHSCFVLALCQNP